MGIKRADVFEVVSEIQTKKEKFRIQPSHALWREIKEAIGGIDDGELYALLDAEVDSRLLRRVRTINGYAYCVAEE